MPKEPDITFEQLCGITMSNTNVCIVDSLTDRTKSSIIEIRPAYRWLIDLNNNPYSNRNIRRIDIYPSGNTIRVELKPNKDGDINE